MSIAVGPFWRYYGGKWRAAGRYPQPECDTIIEPFAGAAGYACRWYRHRVILIDASPIIAGIWRYLISASPRDILSIPDVNEGESVDDLPVCQEARWLVGFWMNDGNATPRKTPSKWALSGGVGSAWGGWSDRARSRIARDVARIRHWQIIEGDYTAAPDIEATHFIDPPYQTLAGRHYKAQPDSFRDLGAWTQARRGQLIACDQQGADWLPWTTRISIRSTPGHKRDGESAEVVYHRSIHPSLFGVAP